MLFAFRSLVLNLSLTSLVWPQSAHAVPQISDTRTTASLPRPSPPSRWRWLALESILPRVPSTEGCAVVVVVESFASGLNQD